MKKISEIRKNNLLEDKYEVEDKGNKLIIEGIDKKYGEQIGLYVLNAIKTNEYLEPFNNKNIEVTIKIK